MPPKRKPSRVPNGAKSTILDFLSLADVEKTMKEMKSQYSSPVASFLATRIENIKSNVQDSIASTAIESTPLLHNMFHDVDLKISEKISTNVVVQIPSTAVKTSSRVIKDSIKRENIEEDEEMDTEPASSCVSPPRTSRRSARIHTESPQITSQTTDEEMEEEFIPKTELRMQQLSIKRPQNPMQSAATPKKNLPKLPTRAPLFRSTPSKTEDKMQHASLIKQQILQKKVEQAKKGDERRRLVLERNKEKERLALEKQEERRRKEEKAAELARMNNSSKSPSRKIRNILPVAPKTPNSRQNLASACSATPGRRPAKFGKVDEEFGSNAKATVAISPSRTLQRSTKREKPLIKEEPVSSSTKHMVKAKRSHKQNDDVKNLQRAQEEFLLQQKEEDEAKEAELSRKREERRLQLEEEKREEERREAERVEMEMIKKKEEEDEKRKKKEELEELKRIQLEEAERLRKQAEKEQAEYEKTLEKQAKAKQLGKLAPVTTYDMTPPRVYVATSKNDYGLDDLNSDDDTDQEDAPRKEVPAWAHFAVIRQNVRKDLLNPSYNIKKTFGTIPKLELKLIFGEAVRPKKRGSSAVWRSPMTTKLNV